MKLKLNDKVRVIAGKDRGKSGKIIRIDHKKNRVTVEKVNLRTRHLKKSISNPTGDKITYEAPFSACNVMVIDPQGEKPTRIQYKMLGNGKKERIAVKSQVSLDAGNEAGGTTKKKKVKI